MVVARLVTLGIAAASLALGCAGDRAATPRDEPAQRAEPAAPRDEPAAQDVPPPDDRCAAIRARFTAVHAERTDTCKQDADCACFNPVGGPALGCGGVTDAKTGAELAAIEREFHAASCEWTHQCGPSRCDPQCRAGEREHAL
jgi:hypothetical protein